MDGPGSDLFVQTQRVMRRLDQDSQVRSVQQTRQAMINAVAETYRTEGREPDMQEIARAVDQVLAEEQPAVTPKRKVPLHMWVLGGVISIPLIVPLLRLTEAIVALLLRIFI